MEDAMQLPLTSTPNRVEPESEEDRKLRMLREADTDSVKEFAKVAYATIASLRNNLLPHERDYALALQVLRERLDAEGRTTINDGDFEIRWDVKAGSSSKDEPAIFDALHDLEIDGDKIPAEVLEDVAWLAEPPPTPPPTKKANLTKLRALAKRYGRPIQEIIDRHVVPGQPQRTFVFKPKEKHAERTPLGDSSTP